MTAWEIVGSLAVAMAIVGLAIVCVGLVIAACLYRQMVVRRRHTLDRIEAGQPDRSADLRPRGRRFRP